MKYLLLFILFPFALNGGTLDASDYDAWAATLAKSCRADINESVVATAKNNKQVLANSKALAKLDAYVSLLEKIIEGKKITF